MYIGVDIQAGLYHFGLGLIERENNMYSLIDLKTGEWYEEMSIYYIQTLLKKWNTYRQLYEN